MIRESEFRIPKNEVRVEILLLDGSQVDDYILFLNQNSPLHNGPETVEEFLNANADFIPVKNCRSNEYYLLNLQDVIYVVEKVECAESGYREICLHFRNQSQFTVRHFEQLPIFHSRPVDFFNGERFFLPFIHERRMLYVNKVNVLRISGI